MADAADRVPPRQRLIEPDRVRARRRSAGRIAAALLLLGALTALLLVPDLPTWARFGRYVLGYGATGLLAWETWKRAPELVTAWRAAGGVRRSLASAAVIALALAGMLALRAWVPGFYGKAAQEYGLWEPLSLLCYLGGGALLLRLTRPRSDLDRRRWAAVIGLFAVLALEEIDYFGIFGAMIGRIDGVYSGSFHDVITLAAREVLGPAGLAALAVAALIGLALLWRAGWLDPRFLLRLAFRPASLWAFAGLALLAVAAAEEAHLFGWYASDPTPEEAIELAGALCFAVYALELAACTVRETNDRRTSQRVAPA